MYSRLVAKASRSASSDQRTSCRKLRVLGPKLCFAELRHAGSWKLIEPMGGGRAGGSELFPELSGKTCGCRGRVTRDIRAGPNTPLISREFQMDLEAGVVDLLLRGGSGREGAFGLSKGPLFIILRKE